MATARLLVERGTLRDQSEDRGDYEFAAMPSPGDRIAVPSGDKVEFLTVLAVHHRPVPAGTRAGVPSAQVVAKWTGEE